MVLCRSTEKIVNPQNSSDGNPVQPEPGWSAAHLLLLLLLGVMAWQTLHYYPLLPATMASHFDAAGRPNGFQSRAFFFGLMWAVVLLMAVAFVATPLLLRHIPPRLLNLPNKQYWLAPERIGAAQRIMADEMGWYGAGVTAFLIFVMQLALQANLRRGPLDNRLMLGGLAAFVIFSIFWTIRFYRRLAVPGR
jgi:uncharacterized membrane protein